MSAETKALLFAGDLYVAIQNPSTGVFGAYEKLEADKLEINTPSDEQNKTSKGRNTFGQSLVTHSVPKPTEFGLVLSETTHEIFAMQLSGVVEAINVAGGAFDDQAVTVVPDKWVDIGKGALVLAGLTVENTGGTTTYEIGDDYLINERLGMIKVLSTGAIPAGPVKVSGSAAAVTGNRIIGARNYNHTLKIKLDGINLVTKKDMILEAFQATVSSQAAYDFLGGKIAEVPLKGKLEIPPGGDRPFQLDYID